jgi:acyl-CoA thioesterase-1
MITKSAGAALGVALSLAAACRGGPAPSSAPPPSAGAPATAAAAPPPGAGAAAVLFVGTSLTAGLGVDPEQAYPALVQQKIRAAGLPHQVVNAGVSGETSAAARRRVDWLLDRRDVAVLVLETGANDGLRAQDPGATRANIEAIVARAAEESPPPRVVLVGMQAPPNYGRDYGRRFAALYGEIASRHRLALVPFLLEGVAGVPALNQADGIHPTAEGHRRMAETVWTVLEPVVRAQR